MSFSSYIRGLPRGWCVSGMLPPRSKQKRNAVKICYCGFVISDMKCHGHVSNSCSFERRPYKMRFLHCCVFVFDESPVTVLHVVMGCTALPLDVRCHCVQFVTGCTMLPLVSMLIHGVCCTRGMMISCMTSLTVN